MIKIIKDYELNIISQDWNPVKDEDLSLPLLIVSLAKMFASARRLGGSTAMGPTIEV